MDVHRRAVERVRQVHERLDRRPDDGRRAALQRLALRRVEVADAAQHDPLRRDARCRGPGPRARRRRPGTCRRGSRSARLGGVEVAVGVEPQDPRVGPVAADGGQRGQRDRALGRRRGPGPRRRPARRRPGRRPRAGSRARPRGPRRSRSSAARRASRSGAARVPSRSASSGGEGVDAAQAARAAVGGAAAEADDPVRRRRLSGPSSCGSRFSKNAVTPSTMSSVETAIVSCAWQVLERVGEGHVQLAEHRVLAQPHDHRRLRGELLRPVGHRVVELVGRHDAVDDPDPLGLLARRCARPAAAARSSSCAGRCGRSAP